jgi:isocitrate/isopropylmalate dehydrogenase
MSTPRIVVLPGDGIGPEVTQVALRVAQAAGLDAQIENHEIGWECWREQGDALPAKTLEACRGARAVFLGAITSKSEDQAQAELAPHLQGQGLRYRSPIIRLRKALDLHINLRPAQGNGLDLVVFRENTEDLYTGHEAHPVPGPLADHFPGLPVGEEAAVSLRVITKTATRRIAEAAFAHAQRNGLRRVTLVEKPNVLRVTGGLVRRTFYEVAQDHPQIEADDLNVDAACALLVRQGEDFQVIVATNLFGDIISDLAAELAGGLSLAPSANLGDPGGLFEPVHGSAPTIAGRGIANPIGAVRAAAMMARHLGQLEVAQRIDQAVQHVLAQQGLRTLDQGGQARTRDIEDALLEQVGDPVRVRQSR